MPANFDNNGDRKRKPHPDIEGGIDEGRIRERKKKKYKVCAIPLPMRQACAKIAYSWSTRMSTIIYAKPNPRTDLPGGVKHNTPPAELPVYNERVKKREKKASKSKSKLRDPSEDQELSEKGRSGTLM